MKVKELVPIIQVVILAVSVFIAFWQFKAYHERVKKQATIEFVNNIREAYRKINNDLVKEFGEGPLDDEKIEKLTKNQELWAKLKDMLALFEHLAVGVNTGVFDFHILSRMSGGYIIKIYDQYSYYIKKRRRDTGNPRIYIEFENLVLKLKKERQDFSNEGNIKYSD